MSELHPDWQSTDSDAPVGTTESATPVTGPIAGIHVSRKPAAIAGMLAVLAIGIGFAGGLNSLTGALSETSDIRITASGVLPQTLTVAPGTEVFWFNESETPHILISNDVCGSNGDCLYTCLLYTSDAADDP